MKLRNKKKGFTIVELVVVIAVIAVLAAVLIPTFSNIVKKAQKSSDTQLVRNLNTALVVDGSEPTTMYDALKAAEEAGYLVDKINVSQKENEILWDSVNNCFVYMEKGKSEPTYIPDTEKKTVKPYQLWKIVDEIPTIDKQKYSLYLTGETHTEAVEVSVGFDAGKNTNLSSVTYNHNDSANPQNTVIRTNGGKLIVNAASDTVNHYGEVENVNIIAVFDNSYHEKGKAGYVEIKAGRFVGETGSKVIALVSTGANVIVETKSDAIINAAYTTVANTNTSGNVALSTDLPFNPDDNAEKEEFIYNVEAQIINAVMVNGQYYKTFDDVFEKCPAANGTGYDLTGDNAIKLLRDVEGPGLYTKDNSNDVKVEFDFNGYTYTVNGKVGSAGYASQAMHFGSGITSINEVTLKNGTLKVKDGVGVAMAMQNYAKLTIDHMTIDYSNISVEFYGENEFKADGPYAKYNGLEAPVFNGNYNKGYASMVIKDSTIICPEESTAGIYFEGTQGEIINSTIKGYVAVSSDGAKGSVKITSSTIEKGVKAYFAADELNTTVDGETTTYSIK